MSAFSPGLLLCDRFEVVRRLGAGGLAEVFQARDRVSGQEVALNVLHDHLMQDGSLAERFRREVALTRSLDHPAIVRVFDLHEHGGRPFSAWSCCAGGRSRRACRRARFRPARRAGSRAPSARRCGWRTRRASSIAT